MGSVYLATGYIKHTNNYRQQEYISEYYKRTCLVQQWEKLRQDVSRHGATVLHVASQPDSYLSDEALLHA